MQWENAESPLNFDILVFLNTPRVGPFYQFVLGLVMKDGGDTKNLRAGAKKNILLRGVAILKIQVGSKQIRSD